MACEIFTSLVSLPAYNPYLLLPLSRKDLAILLMEIDGNCSKFLIASFGEIHIQSKRYFGLTACEYHLSEVGCAMDYFDLSYLVCLGYA